MKTCKICGYENKNINYHINKYHNLTKLEYITMYGNIKQHEKLSNIVKKSWKLNINHQNTYTLDETIKKLKPIYKNYFGTGKNRKLMLYDLTLYNSVIKYSEPMVNVFKLQNAYYGNYVLSYKLKFIVEYECNLSKLKCMCGKKYNFTGLCKHCPVDRSNMKNRKHSPQTKLKMRLTHLNHLRNVKGQLAPRYNINSIPIIEKYGKDYNFNFMHAENGGEFYIKELGYYVDAYDPVKNVILEIDEEHHFKNGKLREKDIQREYEITKLLNCKFIRIKYEGFNKI